MAVGFGVGLALALGSGEGVGVDGGINRELSRKLTPAALTGESRVAGEAATRALVPGSEGDRTYALASPETFVRTIRSSCKVCPGIAAISADPVVTLKATGALT